MNKFLRTEWFALLILAASIGLGFWAHPKLPDQVPSHWNLYGAIDGYTTPTGHVGMFIGLMLGMYLLLLLVPHFEPRKQNLAESIGFLHLVKNFLLAFFLLLFTAITLLALGIYDLDIPKIISVGIGGMFIAFGLYMGRIKSNFFMGIRTPWTLSSDEIWHKTHALGSKLFALSGIGFVLGPVLSPPLNFLLPISLLLLAAIVPVLYSFWLYQKH